MALEMAVRLDPLKLDYRFNLAFQYAQDKSTALLAFYHYKKLVNQDRKHPSALNNFALLVNELRMPATHVSMLSQAKSFESPYPHGNLSIRLAEAGFLESALEVLEELPPDKRLETRAVDAANFIRRKRVEEEKRFERIVDDSEMLQNIYFKAAESMHSPRVLNSILGEWEGTSGERLSLDETAGPDRLDGTLTRGSSNYDLRLRAVGSLLTGTARTKSAGLMTQWEEIINLVVESNRRLEGVIGRDELGLKKVKFNRV